MGQAQARQAPCLRAAPLPPPHKSTCQQESAAAALSQVRLSISALLHWDCLLPLTALRRALGWSVLPKRSAFRTDKCGLLPEV